MADDVRLIDANAAKEKLGFAIEPLVGSDADMIRNDAILDAIKIVDSMPTVDAHPLKRGMWYETHCDLICGVCKWEYNDELPYMSRYGNDYEAFSFCPHCGSRLSPPDGAFYEIEDFGGDADER